MKFATRTEFEPETSGLEDAISARRLSGARLLDLTVTNPTRCGFSYNDRLIAGALTSVDVMRYDAHALGLPHARQVIAEAYYGKRGVSVSPDHIMLTASTSEAYGYLFRLLCDPGDQVLVPQPSYPLFDLLARMHDVEAVPYPLVYHDGWQVDAAGLEQAVTQNSRAIIVVHPNNPTGHFASAADRAALRRVADRHGLALIADEVFLDYPVQPREQPVSFLAEPSPVLLFVLSGISKVLALPQMKLAWTTVRGPEATRNDALSRLETIADTFLNVGGPAQNALERWMVSGEDIRREITDRLRVNLAAMQHEFRHAPLLGSLPVEGGWSAVVRVPALEDDTELAGRLLRKRGIVVHPGSFYGFGRRGWIVLSLVTPVEIFAEGVAGLVTEIAEITKGVP